MKKLQQLIEQKAAFDQTESYKQHLLEELAALDLKEDELVGAMIIARAILAPLRRIAENAGINSPVIVEQVQDLILMEQQ